MLEKVMKAVFQIIKVEQVQVKHIKIMQQKLTWLHNTYHFWNGVQLKVALSHSSTRNQCIVAICMETNR